MVLLNTAHYKESNEKRKSNLCMDDVHVCTKYLISQD